MKWVLATAVRTEHAHVVQGVIVQEHQRMIHVNVVQMDAIALDVHVVKMALAHVMVRDINVPVADMMEWIQHALPVEDTTVICMVQVVKAWMQYQGLFNQERTQDKGMNSIN